MQELYTEDLYDYNDTVAAFSSDSPTLHQLCEVELKDGNRVRFIMAEWGGWNAGVFQDVGETNLHLVLHSSSRSDRRSI